MTFRESEGRLTDERFRSTRQRARSPLSTRCRCGVVLTLGNHQCSRCEQIQAAERTNR